MDAPENMGKVNFSVKLGCSGATLGVGEKIGGGLRRESAPGDFRLDQRVTTTVVPTPTRPNRSMISALCIRMQPCDTKPPIEPGLLVPWIAYSPPKSVIAAAPIGLDGEPPAITFGSEGFSRLIIAGGLHAGRRCLPLIIVVPCHCMPTVPTPTG